MLDRRHKGDIMVPSGLLCEMRRDPVGVEAARPRFSWRLPQWPVCKKQTAYQIQVASALEALMAGQADVWDSGPVETEQSFACSLRRAAFESGGMLLLAGPYLE